MFYVTVVYENIHVGNLTTNKSKKTARAIPIAEIFTGEKC